MKYKEIFYPETQFGGYTRVDGTIAFYNRVNSIINSSDTVLDVGCGRGALIEDQVVFRKNLRILKEKAATVIGIDVSKESKRNPYIDKFYHIKNDSWPIKSNSIDLILCDNVLEHIQYPEKFFSEIYRVSKNGAKLCIRTPNKWSYFAIAAKIIPNKYHPGLTSIVQGSRKIEDVFPTVYKCNSIWALKRMMKKFGIMHVIYCHEPEPSYLSFSRYVYFLGVLYQRFAPTILKSVIFAFGRISKDSVAIKSHCCPK